MDRDQVTKVVLGFIVITSGCLHGIEWTNIPDESPTTSSTPLDTPRPHPIPPSEFTFNFEEQDATELVSITLTQHSEPLEDIPVRIYIGDYLAYHDGEFKGPYRYSHQFKNEWQNGISPGDTIKLAKGSQLPFHEEIRIEVTTESLDKYITIESTTTPRPNTQFELDYHHTGNSTAIAITHVGGDALQEDDMIVTIGGTVAYRNGTFQNEFGNGKAASNGWQYGITKNTTLILSNGTSIPNGTVVEIRREETLYLLTKSEVHREDERLVKTELF